MKNKLAFTLAELLATLMLIGVVAALTIPFLFQEFSKEKWTVTFKRSFAETFNALTRMALEEDCNKSLTCTHLFDDGQAISTKNLGDAMTSVMAVAENCGTKTGSNCFSHKVKVGLSGNKEQTLKETMSDKVNFAEGSDFETGFYTFRTVRGVSYAVLSFGLKCLNERTADNAQMIDAYLNAYVNDKDNPSNQMLSLCGFIVIDVNGPQGPNVWGRDVFGMWITDRSVLGVYPFGGEFDNAFYNKCNMPSEDDAQDTRGCAAQLIQDGWKMKY